MRFAPLDEGHDTDIDVDPCPVLNVDPRHRDGRVKYPVEIDRTFAFGGGPRESLETAHRAPHPLGALESIAKRQDHDAELGRRMGDRLEVLDRETQVSHRVGERIVDFVRDACGKYADGGRPAPDVLPP